MPLLSRIASRHLYRSSLIAMTLIALHLIAAIPSAGAPVGDPPRTVEYGDTGTLPGYALTIVNVDFDAEEILQAFDPSGWHISDTAFVMVQVEATYTGGGTGRPGEDMSFTLTDTEGYFYDLTDHGCPAWPFPPDEVTLQPGETARFNLCFTMPLWLIQDVGVELIVHTNLLTDQWPLTFALDKPQPEEPLDCGCVLQDPGWTLG